MNINIGSFMNIAFFFVFFFAPILILGIERAAWNWTHLANRSTIYATHFGRLRTHIEICEKWANINIDIWSSNRFFNIKEKRANINILTHVRKTANLKCARWRKKMVGFLFGYIYLLISNSGTAYRLLRYLFSEVPPD